MKFKVVKEASKPVIKMANFRLPEPLLEELREVAEAEGISVTELVRQMLRFCIDEYNTKKK